MTRAAFVVAALLALAAPAAWARDISIEDLEATLDVRADGTVDVVEKIRVRFDGEWNGIVRVIPYADAPHLGVRRPIRLTLDEVEGEGGEPLEHWTTRARGRLEVKIRVPGATDASRTVLLRYHLDNLVRLAEGDDAGYAVHDEVFWNVTGNDWEMPITHASAIVRLPETVPAAEVRWNAWTGSYGNEGKSFRAEATAPNAVHFETTSPLGQHEGLTVVVGFPPGHVRHPTLAQRALWAAEVNWPVVIPLGLLLAWFIVWWKRGRDAMRGRTVIPEFEAPAGLTPSEAGVLTDDRLDPRDVSAAILDLAVRGVLKIEETGTGKDTSFLLRLDPERKADLAPFEIALVEGLFGKKTETELADLKFKFGTDLRLVRERLLQGVAKKGWFRDRPDRVLSAWTGGTWMVLILAVVGGIWAQWPLPYWVALVLVTPFLFILSRRMPQRTSTGLDMLAHVRGIEEYIVTAEKDRMRALPLPQVERLLPFAVALGIEDRWAAAFGDLFQTPPDWYAGTGAWNRMMLPHMIGRFHGSVGSNLYAVRRTSAAGGSGYGGRSWGGGWSGGGGFSSGGGFSGGGFGGGGGRGW